MNSNMSLSQNILQKFHSVLCTQHPAIFAHISFLQPHNIPSKVQRGNREVFVPILLLALIATLRSECGLVEKDPLHIYIHLPTRDSPALPSGVKLNSQRHTIFLQSVRPCREEHIEHILVQLLLAPDIINGAWRCQQYCLVLSRS